MSDNDLNIKAVPLTNLEEIKKGVHSLRVMQEKFETKYDGLLKNQISELKKDIENKYNVIENQAKSNTDSINSISDSINSFSNSSFTKETDIKQFDSFKNIVKTYKNNFVEDFSIEEKKSFAEIHKSTLNKYLRSKLPTITDLKGYLSDVELKTFNSSIDPEGGYFVMPEFSSEIIKVAKEVSPIRENARVVNVSGRRFIQPVMFDAFATTQNVGENQAGSEKKLDFKQVEIDIFAKRPFIEITEELIEDSNFNIANFLIEELREQIAQDDNADFVNGDGNGKPEGLLNPADGTSYGQVQRIATGTANDIDSGDDILKLMSPLKNTFRAGAKFYGSRQTFFEKLLTLKTTDNHYIVDSFNNPTTAGSINMSILGVEFVDTPDMVKPASGSPFYTTGDDLIIFGNLSRGYTIADRMGMSVFVDRNGTDLASKGLVRYYFRRRLGARPTNTEAYKVLRAS